MSINEANKQQLARKYYKVKELAYYFNIGVTKMRMLIKENNITKYEIGGACLYSIDEAEKKIIKKEKNV